MVLKAIGGGKLRDENPTWLYEFEKDLGRVDIALAKVSPNMTPEVKELWYSTLNLLNKLRVKANCEKYGYEYSPK